MKNIYSVLSIILLTSSVLFAQDSTNLITFHSMGPISLCQDANSITVPFIRDSTLRGDGFEFYGKFFGTEDSNLLVAISLYDSATIHVIKTLSPKFHTEKGIAVGSTLQDLFKSKKDLMCIMTYSEYDDFCFMEIYQNSRIVYRVDKSTEKLIWKLPMDDSEKFVNEVEGLLELIDNHGATALIREISVVQTGICEQ